MKVQILWGIFGILIASGQSQDCSSFVINECARDACAFSNEKNIGSLELCQLLCEFWDESFTCQSFAYSSTFMVSYS